MTRPRHGFTLIELLAVIAIVAILTLIAVAGTNHFIRGKTVTLYMQGSPPVSIPHCRIMRQWGNELLYMPPGGSQVVVFRGRYEVED